MSTSGAPATGPRPKVLHILSGRERGGITRVVSSVAVAADRFEPVVLILGEAVSSLSGGLRVRALGERPTWSRKLARRVEAVAREEGARLVHSHNVIANLYGSHLRRRQAGLAHVVQVHAHLHALLEQNQRSRIKREVLLFGNGRALRACDAVIAVSGSIKEYLARFRVPPGKIHVIHNAIDPRAIEEQARRPCEALDRLPASGGPRVGIFGRLVPAKNHELFLEAARRVLEDEPATFVIVGDGPSRQTLEARATALGIQDHVVFAGWQANPYPLLAAMDVVALTSSSEGFGIALTEAMALGRPVVATRVGGVPEILRDGAGGDLVPEGDPAAVARGILGFLRDPERRRACGQDGRRAVEERFGQSAMGRKMTAVYETALGSRGKRAEA